MISKIMDDERHEILNLCLSISVEKTKLERSPGRPVLATLP